MLVKVRDSLLRFKGLLLFGFLIFAVLGLLSGVPAANGADSTTPKVSSTDPVNNAVEVPGDKVIKVNFNEPVKAGTNWIELERSDGKGMPVTKSIGTKVLTVTPKSLLTHGNKYKLIVHTGSLTDLAGNPVALYTTNFKVDSVAPKVSSTDPKNNAVEVSGDKVIKVNFNEPVKAGTNWVELKNSKGTVIPITKSIGTKVLTVTPKSLLTHGTKYNLIIHTGSLTDLAGNPVKLYDTVFTVDSVAPKVSSTDPKNNAAQVPCNKVIKVNFNEPVKTGNNWVELKNSKGTVIPITKSIGTKVLTVTPKSFLTHGTKYNLAIHTGSLTDMAGNPVALYTTSFTVDSTTPTVTASLPSGVYSTTKAVTLTAKDNCDPNPRIYYTVNNKNPTTSSTLYTSPITISTKTTLKFMAVDDVGNQAVVQSRTYNITTPKTIQALLNIKADNVLSLPSRTTGLNISQQINLTDAVTWVSVVYHHVDEPGICEVNVIVNGNIILTKWFTNPYSLWFDEELWWFEYGDPAITGMEINPDLFMAYGRLLNFAEQNDQELSSILQEMYNDPDLTEGDHYLAYYHRDSFRDNIHTTLTYSGRSLTKNETITYINGQNARFEIIQSFAIATNKVTDNMVQYWLNKNSTYPEGYMKASYGTFMTALTTLWLSDKLADEMTPKLNVTWSRDISTVVTSGVTSGRAYVHCQDPTIGMTVAGDGGDVKFFRLVCSLLLSEVEKASLSGTGLSVNSTFSTFMSAIMTGKHFKMSGDNKTVTIILEEDPSFKIIIDYETGIVKEITNINGFPCKGALSTESAYCYHDQLSNHLPEFISAVKQDVSNLFNQLDVGWIEDHYGEIKNGVEIIATGAGIIVTKLSILAAVEVMIRTGNGAIYFRDNYLPKDFWLKVSYHNIWNNDVYWYVDPNDHQMHYVEVPK